VIKGERDVAGRRRALLAISATLVAGGCGAPPLEEMVPVLSEPRADADQLPTLEGATRIEGVDADSTRYLGKTGTAEYWVGLDGEEICLVQALVGAEAVGVSCADAETFAEVGVPLSTSASGVSATGLLLPEGFDLADAVAGEGWVSVTGNLAAPSDEVSW
jgi:hypothetical protein